MFFCLCKQAGVLAGAIFRFGPLIARAAFGGSCCLWKQLAFLRARLRFASLRLRAPDRAKGTKVSPAGSVSALLCATGTRRPSGLRMVAGQLLLFSAFSTRTFSSFRGKDGSTACHIVAVIEHHSLSRRHGALGRLKLHLHGSVLHGDYHRRSRRRLIAHLGL